MLSAVADAGYAARMQHRRRRRDRERRCLPPLTRLGIAVVLLVTVSCQGNDEAATVPGPQGVETFSVTASHTNDPVAYPQVPPVGGPHHPTWEPCTFYDRPVPSERAVHSLEHGAIWVTYRPDLPGDQIDALARLAGSREDMLVSRWDEGLPAPVVVSSWGRQLKLDSVTDPRLVEFADAPTSPGSGCPAGSVHACESHCPDWSCTAGEQA